MNRPDADDHAPGGPAPGDPAHDRPGHDGPVHDGTAHDGPGCDGPGAASRAIGRLFLVPVPLGPDDDPMRVLPPATVAAVTSLDYFVAEHPRSARAVLGRLPMARPLQALEIRTLDHRTPDTELAALLAPLLAGRDAGLVSEAGCPAVADPGAGLVALAHRQGVRVVPLIGPSALLLALMASGMNGQAFSFAGYVPVPPPERARRLQALERRSADNDETILLIETPYRNQALFDAMLDALGAETWLGVAAALSLPDEQVTRRRVADWRAHRPALARVPTVFTLQAPSAGPRSTEVSRAPPQTGGSGRMPVSAARGRRRR